MIKKVGMILMLVTFGYWLDAQTKVISGVGTTGRSLYDFESNDSVSVGVCNGINRVFTLPVIPLGAQNIKVYKNGIHQRLNSDFTVNNRTVTFTTAPQTFDTIDFDYQGYQ